METNKWKVATVVLSITVLVLVIVLFVNKSSTNDENAEPASTIDTTGTTGSNVSPSTNTTIKKSPTTSTKTGTGQTVKPETLDLFAINFVSPVLGPIGTTITVHGEAFSRTGNTVVFNKIGRGYIRNLPSADGNTITLKVPSTLVINGKTMSMETGTYDVSVIDARGKETKTVSFVVTAQ